MAMSLAERLDRLDFETVFRLQDGDIRTVRDQYAPEVFHSDTEDIEVWGDGWTALTGFTDQYGYSGAAMHSSEFIGSRMADRIAELAEEDPQTVFTVVTVECFPEDDDEEPEPAGWAVLYRAGH